MLFLAAALPGLTQTSRAQTVAEQYLLQLTNQNRAEHGLAPLAWDDAIARAARTHAMRMLREASLEHQYAGEADLATRAAAAGGRFATVAENLSSTTTSGRQAMEEIVRAWMNSPDHRANILDPRLTTAGIAVVPANGMIYAVQDFARQTPALGYEQIEQRAIATLNHSGIATSSDPARQADARADCDTSSETHGQPQLVILWDGPNLNELPATVNKQMLPGAVAVVGACALQNGSGTAGKNFSSYKLAVLLY